MKEFKKYFLYVGNAYPHKNLERAIKAAANLKALFYIVTSRNIFTNRLQKLIKKINTENYVKILGFVDDEKLNELYKNSIGFIYPSLSEGFGLPGLEAMKAKTILLCSDIPVFKEIYADNAIYFDPIDIKSIESSMEKVLSLNKKIREKRIKKADMFVKKYSWKKMARQTLEIYNILKIR